MLRGLTLTFGPSRFNSRNTRKISLLFSSLSSSLLLYPIFPFSSILFAFLLFSSLSTPSNLSQKWGSLPPLSSLLPPPHTCLIYNFPSFHFISFLSFFPCSYPTELSFVCSHSHFFIIIFISPFDFIPFITLFDTWLNMSHPCKCHVSLDTPYGYHAMYPSPRVPCGITMCHPTLDASKDLKFRLFRNPTKFDWVARFHETNSTVKSVSSSEI